MNVEMIDPFGTKGDKTCGGSGVLGHPNLGLGVLTFRKLLEMD